MRITANGESMDVPVGTTVDELIEIMGMDPSRVAVEIEGEICPRDSRASRVLEDGQSLEIVGFVGGG